MKVKLHKFTEFNLKLLWLSVGFMLMVSCKTIELREERFLHPENNAGNFNYELVDYDFTAFDFTRTDGTIAYGTALTKPDNELTIVFYGGNKFSMAAKGLEALNELSQFNANVYLFDHRGYGRSTDRPTLKLLMQDALENYDFVRAKTSGKLILHGHSMGSFEAGWVARHRDLDALVLESSVTHIDEWVDGLLPWFIDHLVKFNIQDELRIVDNYQAVERLDSHLLLMVGSKDKLTPKKLSQKLFTAATTHNKTLRIFKKANHTDVRTHPDFNTVYQSFIDSVMR